MNFFENLSIRKKLGILLAGVTTLMLLFYSWMVLTAIQKDRIAYIFDSSLMTSSSAANQIHQTLNQSISRLNFYLKQYTPQVGFSQQAKDMITHETMLQGIYILPNSSEAAPGLETQFLFQHSDFSSPAPWALQKLRENPSREFALLFNKEDLSSWYLSIRHPERKLQILVRLPYLNLLDLLEASHVQQSYLVDEQGKIILFPRAPVYQIENEKLSSLSEKLFTNGNRSLFTTEIEIDKAGLFLTSVTPIGFKNIKILSIVSKAVALEGLYVLLVKSLLFLCPLLAGTMILSVIAPSGMTRGLRQLFQATKQIEAGNFELQLPTGGQDEVGGLSRSFNHMIVEIKRLLKEEIEKARMQSELKTAQTIQENLFPPEEFQNKQLEISGLYLSASECGGDWWYYFEHPTGVYVFICDATGHGAPAALITAAAKASVNLMIREKVLNIQKLTEAFNYALHETTKGKILMTGFVLHIKPDQTVDYVNASHEPPLLFNSSGIDFLIDPIGPRFGQNPDTHYEVGTLSNLSDQMILMYTDGITGQADAKGKELGDKRFMRFLTKEVDYQKMPLTDINHKVFGLVSDFRETVPQADDLTIVSIRFPKCGAES